MPAPEEGLAQLADAKELSAEVLEVLSGLGGPLHVDAADASWKRHVVPGTDPHLKRYSAARVRLHEQLINEFLAENRSVARDGRAVVATAGPPAAGKSRRLTDLGYGPEWRRIDADDFKQRLIEVDHGARTLVVPEDVEGLVLPDGRGVMRMELAGLYHHESTAVADKARARCMEAHENLIVEGTLSYRGAVPVLNDDLQRHGYESLEVLLVEVPERTAHQQAIDRWWEGREGGEPGGRFTPAAVISGMYTSSGGSICAGNAVDLVDGAQARGIAATLKR